MKSLFLRAAPFAAGIALMSAGAFADDVSVLHSMVDRGGVQAGPACDKVSVDGGFQGGGALYGFDKSRADIQTIIFRHMDTGTDLNYQLGALPMTGCNDGGQTLRQIIWVN